MLGNEYGLLIKDSMSLYLDRDHKQDVTGLNLDLIFSFYGEALTHLELDETIKIVLYGSYVRRDKQNDVISNITVKSNVDWLQVEIKPSELKPDDDFRIKLTISGTPESLAVFTDISQPTVQLSFRGEGKRSGVA